MVLIVLIFSVIFSISFQEQLSCIIVDCSFQNIYAFCLVYCAFLRGNLMLNELLLNWDCYFSRTRLILGQHTDNETRGWTAHPGFTVIIWFMPSIYCTHCEAYSDIMCWVMTSKLNQTLLNCKVSFHFSRFLQKFSLLSGNYFLTSLIKTLLTSLNLIATAMLDLS